MTLPFEGEKLPSEKDEEVCPHSHLKISTLKKIGHVIKKVGKAAGEVAIEVALQNLGAFKQ